MKPRDSLAPLVIASVVVTTLITLTVEHGWLAWARRFTDDDPPPLPPEPQLQKPAHR